MTTDARRIADDLGYVRHALATSDRDGFPPAILYLWGAVSVVGFSLIDFAPHLVGRFWMVASPVGFVLSAWMGRRHARRAGQFSGREARSYAVHWAALLIALAMLAPMALNGSLTGLTLGRVILVIIALGYALAALHQARVLGWVALVVAAGYFATFVVDRYVWTAIGVVTALGLFASGRSLAPASGGADVDRA